MMFTRGFRARLAGAIWDERRRARLAFRFEEIMLTQRIADFEDLVSEAAASEAPAAVATFKRDLAEWQARRNVLRVAGDLAGHGPAEYTSDRMLRAAL